mmetsp:Transcript_24055/g.58083  ORF Transcript_24055/g.58083 Transcript_24055/m.58083 type:complete len:221 (+) Transcript_24055:107-769(+)|eukprot:CAMPEP_0181113100 /NCGR_PEP_ID=MMETSP1071-20121207/20164_1 /TAXON_ID=35127 /ORGANISM="Thalassiosira sp., Strain NH16" /LENGTH=220 /DNA_ID=CAMNT_0023197109 /DNA_START=57 /DNA_END=719 /DNA_ORIENTATION=+
MSDVSKTAPTVNKQVIRAIVLVSILAGCSWYSSNQTDATSSSHMTTLIHLVAFSSWFGCSVWVSFVSGLVMFKNLPRHVFGRLQSKLFPAFFQFSTVTVILAIATSSAVGGGSTASDNDLPYSLIIVLACTLLNLLFFEPETTRVMYKRHAIEKRLGTGHEVGKLRPEDPNKANNPELKAISKTFGMLHGISSSLSLITLGFGCVWLSKCASQMAGLASN